MYCNKCGASNPDDANFCSKCGKAIAGASPPPTAPVKKPQVVAQYIAPPPLDVLAPQPALPVSGSRFWVGFVAVFLLFVLLFLYRYSKEQDAKFTGVPVPSPPVISQESTPKPSSPAHKMGGTLSSDAVGCLASESAEKIRSMSVAGDRQAVNLMMIAGLCEIVYSGTRLDAEDISIFSTSRYRLFGTGRSLYVIQPNFN